jgi:hypothetical protein
LAWGILLLVWSASGHPDLRLEARHRLISPEAARLAASSAGAALNVGDEGVVVTKDGAVAGTVASSYRAFLGIPYAVPPLGSLRWSSPLPAQAWAPSVLNATGKALPHFLLVCLQELAGTHLYFKFRKGMLDLLNGN